MKNSPNIYLTLIIIGIIVFSVTLDVKMKKNTDCNPLVY